MSDSGFKTDSPATGDKPREIRLAAILMLIVGAGGLIQAINAFLQQRHLRAGTVEIGNYLAPATINYRTADLRGSVILALALGLIALVAFPALSLTLRRGMWRARIAVFVISAVLIVGQVILIASDGGSVKTGGMVTAIDVPGGDPAVAERLNDALVLGWFPVVHYISELLVLGAVILLLLQLLRGPAVEYLRRLPRETESADDAKVWSAAALRRANAED